MASTRLVRKALRNRTVSKKRVSKIKRLTSKPVIKNVDIEQIKAEFASNKAKPTAKKEAPTKEVAEVATPEVKEEKKAAPKKTAAKKTTAKAKEEKKPKAKKEDSKAKD